MELHRSLIFVPGIRENMLEKAGTLAADVVVLDLEDSVSPGDKVAARDLVRRQIPRLAAAGQSVHVRVNGLPSGLTRDDLGAVVCPQLSGVALPKAESPQDIRDIDVLLREQELAHDVTPGTIALIPFIESARGLLRCEEMCRSSSRLAAIALGADDYTADLAVHRTREGHELSYARQVIATCCAASGLLALDTPYDDFRDEEGLIAETEWVKTLGFKGKYLIHPAQMEPVNRVFRPSEEEVAEARRTMAAFEEAEAQGLGSIQLEGRMVDRPVALRARQVIAVAEAIEAREGSRG